ncbi:TrlF family AAA-like ATPase [Leptospira sarikeiensis]|uniref:DNA repair protein n=1 Tax=Leptospira sarikeiensis TaxID=2484943 RepID=A0A4R9K5F9_9LEPT|nr:AAA family ATPase [Leptospira sarikeiensis]TGL59507.1 DNA repair protein [Leptospira sarikeiensis]
MKNYARGSEWRKWDLHIHTPKSIVQSYGGDTPEVWEKFITDLESLPPEFKVIGINDYIFLDGYKEVIRLKEQGRLPKIELILPIVELRIDRFASIGDEAWKKVNLHVIFSNELKAEVIETQFLNTIQHMLKLSPDIEGVDFNAVATRESLTDLGKRIRQTATSVISGTDLHVGFSNLFFEYSTIRDKLDNTYLKGQYLTAIGKTEWDKMRWDASAALKKTTINEADFSFISLENFNDYEKHTTALRQKNVRNWLLDCSDAHSFSFSEEKDRIGNSNTWIKADPTFEGLKLVANDKTRIYVGDRPPLLKRIDEKKTKFIRSINFKKIENSQLSESWFDQLELELNPSLVAIIGNKGGGKSAIADSLGLLGNTVNYQYFSFLNDAKFRKKKPINKADNYEANLIWLDEQVETKRLSQDPASTSYEKVKYLPQGFIEKLCSNEDASEFEVELRKVIFSHLPDAERLGKRSLNELIEYKTEILEGELGELKKDIFNLNKGIVDLERKQSDEYRKKILEVIKEKEAEIKAHDLLKPISVLPPTDPDIEKKNEEISTKIKEKRELLNNIENEIQRNQQEEANLLFELNQLEKIQKSILLFKSQYDRLRLEIGSALDKFNIKSEDVVSISLKVEIITALIYEKQEVLRKIQTNLNETNEKGLPIKKILLSDEIKTLQVGLDAQSKLYQKFLDDLKIWNDRKAYLIGSPDKDGTIEFLQAQILYLDTTLDQDLQAARLRREEKLSALFHKKEETLTLYKSLFKPVSDFISTYGNLLENYKVNLDVNYKNDSIVDKFFEFISLNAKGSFIGSPEGYERLKQLLERYNLENREGLINFLKDLLDHLHFDQREGFKNEKRDVERQLKKGNSVLDLYSYLFNLDYLEPEFKLKLGEKNVSELSPGERGALLLIFYLSLDQSDSPLIIDQPEENLDNQSVFKILVQFINEAKNKRQIIIVTHNPNLAVACNADQIVYVSIDKANRNKVNFASGSLEERIINDAVVDILEGTFPALNSRTNTYKIIKREA